MILAAALKVLMIGNSLTYANDLPATVERLMDTAGVEATVDSVATPDTSLGDHWERATARRAIEDGHYDVVVLQQGPSAAPDNRVLLERDAARFAELVRASGGRTALYMVWPSRGRTGDVPGVDASYTDAAERCGCLLLPAGRAWRMAIEDGETGLYGPDGFHPSATGSYLAALVIAAGILDKDPSTLAAPASMPREKAERLRRSARGALSAEARTGRASGTARTPPPRASTPE